MNGLAGAIKSLLESIKGQPERNPRWMRRALPLEVIVQGLTRHQLGNFVDSYESGRMRERGDCAVESALSGGRFGEHRWCSDYSDLIRDKGERQLSPNLRALRHLESFWEEYPPYSIGVEHSVDPAAWEEAWSAHVDHRNRRIYDACVEELAGRNSAVDRFLKVQPA